MLNTFRLPALTLSLALAAMLAWIPGTGHAQSSEGLREVTEQDDRWLWRSVGRLDLRDGTCTGALVSYRHVLTSAHCVYTRDGRALRDAGGIIFRAGLRNGRPYASHRGRRILVHPDYDPTDDNRSRQIASDIAILELSRPIQDKTVKPFTPHDRPHSGREVTVVSYGEDRNLSPSIQDRCALLRRDGDALLYDCAATFGSSGAPVMVQSQSGPQLVSVLAAINSIDGQHVTAAAALGEGFRELFAMIQTPEADVKRIGNGRKSLSEQLGRSTSKGLPQITR